MQLTRRRFLGLSATAAAALTLGTLTTQMPRAYGDDAETFSVDGITYQVLTDATDENGATVQVGTAKASSVDVGDGLVDSTQTAASIPAVVEHEGTAYAVTAIGSYAFHDSALTFIELPEGLETINTYAFLFCRKLESLTVPSTVTTINKYAFFACNALASISFESESSLTTIGSGAFAIPTVYPSETLVDSPVNSDNSAALLSVSIPASVETIGTYAFYGQTALASLEFEGEEMTAIKDWAFRACTALKRVELPLLTSTDDPLGRYAFADNPSLAHVAFLGAQIKRVVYRVGYEFSGSENIETIVFYDRKWNYQNVSDSSYASGVYGGGNNMGGYSNGDGWNQGTLGFADSPDAKVYYTVKQYATVEDAEAGENCLGQAQVCAGTWENETVLLRNVNAGEVELCSSDEGYAPGAWAWEGAHTLLDTLDNSMYVYAVDVSLLSYGALELSGELDDEGVYAYSILVDEELDLGLTVYNAAGQALVRDTDYTLVFCDSDGSTVAETSLSAGGSFSVTATGIGAYSESLTTSFSVSIDVATWTRMAGDTYLATMGACVQEVYENGSTAEEPCTWIVVTSAASDATTEALSAVALAGALKAPVVFAEADALPSETKYEFTRTHATKALIVGDASLVSDDVMTTISNLYYVTNAYRIAGSDSCSTAAKVATLGVSATIGATWSDTCIVANSAQYAEALSILPYSYATSSPLFLCDPSSGLSDETLEAIEDGDFARVLIVGDTSAVPESVESALRVMGMPIVQRFSGENAGETSRAVADFSLSEGMLADGMALAASDSFAEAIAGSAMCGRLNSVLMLYGDDSEALGFLSEHRSEISQGYLLSDTDGISDAQEAEVNAVWQS